jgi:hypothetical protein
MDTLSIWPLVAAAAAATAIGYVWFHPRFFGKMWMRLSGMTPEMAEHGARHAHWYALASFFACIIIAFVLRTLLIGLGIFDISGAARLGAVVFLGFAAPILLGSVLWEHRPFALYLLNAGYWLIALVIIAMILVV